MEVTVMVTDPVCGMQVDDRTAKYSFPAGERIYWFCSEGCRSEFCRHPEDYLDEIPLVNGGRGDV
jgi:Cu+-exporting ATPase